jgi:DNA-binding LytR/AlgR family response regulator
MATPIYNCLIIDDEPHIVEEITRLINKTDYLKVKDSTTSPEQGLALLASQKYDIVICDIKLPDISGLDIVSANIGKACFIMSTAYTQYAIDGFDLGVVDYLLKPFNYTRFITAIQRAITVINNQQQKALQNEKPLEHLFVKTNVKGKLEKVNFDEIDYIEGRKNYVAFVTQKKEILTLMNLKDLENQLSKEKFMRVHLSFIISLSKIDKIEGGSILLKERTQHIPIGISYKEIVREKLGIR